MERPTFFLIDDDRIKMSNIKDYGITENCKYHRKLYVQRTMTSFRFVEMIVVSEKVAGISGKLCYDGRDNFNRWKQSTKDLPYSYKGKDLYLVGNDDPNDELGDTVVDKVLYIRTYQGDEYNYYQSISDFSIDEKLKELDRYFT